ncbi:hypothetical protein ACFXPQ_16865 [Streptomyces lydicus]|uniref:hypothetical protein n=1 Tax=Streptomyces lydicus TaxID=47763 RepID=UPI0036868D3C
MDEGTAALYAAIIGFTAAIIGAAVGGWASWKAARHSADAAVQVTVKQIKGQAANEHAHWVRQERRLAYGEVLRAYASLRAAVSRCQRHMIAGIPFINELRDAREKEGALISTVGVIYMLGPREVAEAATILSDEVQTVMHLNIEWAEALHVFMVRSDELVEIGGVGEADGEELDSLLEVADQAGDSATSAAASLSVGYGAFLKASQSVLLAQP